MLVIISKLLLPGEIHSRDALLQLVNDLRRVVMFVADCLIAVQRRELDVIARIGKAIVITASMSAVLVDA